VYKALSQQVSPPVNPLGTGVPAGRHVQMPFVQSGMTQSVSALHTSPSPPADTEKVRPPAPSSSHDAIGIDEALRHAHVGQEPQSAGNPPGGISVAFVTGRVPSYHVQVPSTHAWIAREQMSVPQRK
jgi:hypothetical protein